jgi:hypothetical protein
VGSQRGEAAAATEGEEGTTRPGDAPSLIVNGSPCGLRDVGGAAVGTVARLCGAAGDDDDDAVVVWLARRVYALTAF